MSKKKQTTAAPKKESSKRIVNEKSVAFLEQYINNPAPTGFEKSGQQLWLDYIRPYIDDYFVDTYGTAVGVINPDAPYKVVVEAHADEISWFVHYITSDGFIYLRRNGGSDHQIAPSMRVNIHTDKGIVKGVFGWPAIHVREPGKEESPSMKNLFLEVGATTKAEVEKMGIHVGCVCTFEDEFMIMNDRYYLGRALDNRIGTWIAAEALRLVAERAAELKVRVVAVSTVQEEVGLRGAQMIARSLAPDVALVTDVGHATDSPGISHAQHGFFKLAGGPKIAVGGAMQPEIVARLTEVAGNLSIPLQRAATPGGSGTDTDAIFVQGGIPCGLVSLPIRYMHTTVEMTSLRDLNRIAHLFAGFALGMKQGERFAATL